MGNESGTPIMLVFDCISLGTHEIQTTDGTKLKKVVERLSKRINTPMSQIKNVQYNYSPLPLNSKISELGLKSGAVLQVKFND